MKTMKTLAAASVIGAAATAAVAQSSTGMVFDYETLSGMNDGLTQAQFDGFDTNADGVLDPDEQIGFYNAGYTNETPVEQIAEPTDGLATEN